MTISIDECKERTARLRAKKDCFVKACCSSLHENNDEDLKVIDVSPIRSLFCNMNLNNDGTGDESTLVKRRPDNSEGENHVEKFDKSGFEEVKTLASDVPTLLDYKDFNYDICSLIDYISLLQSMINPPHAYEQNKAFTKHIVDAMMKALEEKLEFEVSIPIKLHDEWEPTIKVKIKNYECLLYVTWVLVFIQF